MCSQDDPLQHSLEAAKGLFASLIVGLAMIFAGLTATEMTKAEAAPFAYVTAKSASAANPNVGRKVALHSPAVSLRLLDSRGPQNLHHIFFTWCLTNPAGNVICGWLAQRAWDHICDILDFVGKVIIENEALDKITRKFLTLKILELKQSCGCFPPPHKHKDPPK